MPEQSRMSGKCSQGKWWEAGFAAEKVNALHCFILGPTEVRGTVRRNVRYAKKKFRTSKDQYELCVTSLLTSAYFSSCVNINVWYIQEAEDIYYNVLEKGKYSIVLCFCNSTDYRI